ncbi:MAG: hypothetical protein PVI00_09250 [Desulfobacterales bacterium]|jgi:hypothetical protein
MNEPDKMTGKSKPDRPDTLSQDPLAERRTGRDRRKGVDRRSGFDRRRDLNQQVSERKSITED